MEGQEIKNEKPLVKWVKFSIGLFFTLLAIALFVVAIIRKQG